MPTIISAWPPRRGSPCCRRGGAAPPHASSGSIDSRATATRRRPRRSRPPTAYRERRASAARSARRRRRAGRPETRHGCTRIYDRIGVGEQAGRAERRAPPRVTVGRRGEQSAAVAQHAMDLAQDRDARQNVLDDVEKERDVERAIPERKGCCYVAGEDPRVPEAASA